MPRMFISYAHVDRSEAIYVRSIINETVINIYKTYGGGALLLPIQLIRLAIDNAQGNTIAKRIIFTSWMDDDILTGTDWEESIRVAITTCDNFVILAPTSLSTNVLIECSMAKALEKPILPIARSVSDLQKYSIDHYQALPWPEQNEAWKSKFQETITSFPFYKVL